MSPSLELLARFRIQTLSPDLVCSANAWDANLYLTYNYNCRVAGENYNCIYDDEPLEGWWPWPKNPGEAGGLFLPPAQGINWEDELFPDLPLARGRRRRQPAAPATNAYYYAPYTYTYPPNMPSGPSGSGCVML
jgi:hypothetical protein